MDLHSSAIPIKIRVIEYVLSFLILSATGTLFYSRRDYCEKLDAEAEEALKAEQAAQEGPRATDVRPDPEIVDEPEKKPVKKVAKVETKPKVTAPADTNDTAFVPLGGYHPRGFSGRGFKSRGFTHR